MVRYVSPLLIHSSPILIYHIVSGWAKEEYVKCVVMRNKKAFTASNLYPTYELVLQGSEKVLIIAMKMKMNRTSNYHLFDMTRGTPSMKLTKKSCNYIGKLRSLNAARTEYVLVTSSLAREEIAGISYERQSLLSHMNHGAQPRKMSVVLPGLDKNKMPIPKVIATDDGVSILDELNSAATTCRSFCSKAPVFENGNYRLNFRGRVNTPSIKNFQLVPNEDIDDVVFQFGKVGSDRFHLDYKTPLNAVQAFCLALCQFNL